MMDGVKADDGVPVRVGGVTACRLEVTCYSLSPHDMSVWRNKIESEVEHFKDISGLQNGDAARLIHADGIDLLINLNGYTKGARNEIFALRPAPIQVGPPPPTLARKGRCARCLLTSCPCPPPFQVSYMGFCGTLGADYVQYLVADPVVIPNEARPFYTERLIHMPHSYFVNDHRQSARYVLDTKALPTRADYGVPEDKFVFCNFNQIYKIDPDICQTWAQVLKRVPNSILWLLRFPPAGEANIRAEMEARGVPSHQVLFSDVAPKDEHIRRGHLADLFLDTPCCNAHTTGCDILWGGTPMLTLSGTKMATRVAASLLHAAQLPELVVQSREEYEELAVELAMDPEKLFRLRQRLEDGRHTCPLFDTVRCVVPRQEREL